MRRPSSRGVQFHAHALSHSIASLNCVFCWSYALLAPVASDAWKAERPSDAHLDAVIDALPRRRPTRLQVSGKGEPMLHPGAPRLLAAARDAGIAAEIQTNGTAGPSPDALADLDVARLLVNVSAGTAAGYEATHPGRGHLFDAVLARLERLAALRARAPAPGRARSAPDVTLVVVVQATNAFEVPAAVDLAARDGDVAEGPFDAKCATWSNFERNRGVHADVAAHAGGGPPRAHRAEP